MVSAVQSKSKIDRLLWALSLTLVAAGVVGYYYLSAQSILVRVIVLLVAIGIAGFVLFQTDRGKNLVLEWQGAVQEVRKMVWPTRRETLHTTLAVLGMVVVMGLLLWTADFLLLHGVSWLTTGQWGN